PGVTSDAADRLGGYRPAEGEFPGCDSTGCYQPLVSAMVAAAVGTVPVSAAIDVAAIGVGAGVEGVEFGDEGDVGAGTPGTGEVTGVAGAAGEFDQRVGGAPRRGARVGGAISGRARCR